MPNNRLADRYAKSLIDLAIEKNQLDIVRADMQYFIAICKVSKDFVNMLRSPIITSDKKDKIIDAIIGKSVSQISMLFIRLLTTKKRESNLPEIVTSFLEQYNKLKKKYKVLPYQNSKRILYYTVLYKKYNIYTISIN